MSETKSLAERLSFQNIFNLAWQRFIVEDAPPAVERDPDNPEYDYRCRYRTSEGRACAVGVALTDEEAKKVEGIGFCDVVYERLGLPPDGVDSGKCRGLQSALHDVLVNTVTGTWAFSKEQRIESYREVAKKFNLTIPGETDEEKV